MKVISITKEYSADFDSVIALGNFDGVHVGHRELIVNCVKMARDMGVKSSVLIFKNHTNTVLEHKNDDLITLNDDKDEILKSIGIDIIYEIEFTKDFMSMSPEDFVIKFLNENLRIKGIVVGFDYRFGYKAMGNAELLKSLSTTENFKLKVIEPVHVGDKLVSSTLIRNEIKDGNVKEAMEMLGHPFTIKGVVVRGKNLATKMNYPTANLKFSSSYVVPKFGVYDTNVIINGKSYKGATSVGTNPTTHDEELKIETFIIDFHEDIYGKKIAVEFIDFIRPEMIFNSVEELFTQIGKDVERVKNR